MALLDCPDCLNEVSDSAPSCIHCGRVKQNGEINCLTCQVAFNGNLTKTFLGFRKFTCPSCGQLNKYGLSKAFRGTYWALLTLIGFIAFKSVRSAEVTYVPVVLAFAMAYALYRNSKLPRIDSERFGRRLGVELVCLALALLAFSYLVWPTPYAYSDAHLVGASPSRIRINRLSGSIDVLIMGIGWEPVMEKAAPLDTGMPMVPNPFAGAYEPILPDSSRD